MKIEVAERHIAAGRPRACHTCPVALAIIEALGRERGTRTVKVDSNRIGVRGRPGGDFYGNAPWHYFDMKPDEARFVAIVDGDMPFNSEKPEPFTLDLPIEDYVARADTGESG